MKPPRRPRDRVVGWRIARGAIPTGRAGRDRRSLGLLRRPSSLGDPGSPGLALDTKCNVERQLGQPRTAVTHTESSPQPPLPTILKQPQGAKSYSKNNPQISFHFDTTRYRNDIILPVET